MYRRIHLIVLDSVGIGQAPDAEQFGDQGCDTLGHIAQAADIALPNLEKLGLGAIAPIATVSGAMPPKGYGLKLEEQSVGKDTMTGHWELMGLVTTVPFPVYPGGFPEELLWMIERYSGRKILCNKPYSGTKVIDDYGPEQMRTGSLIVYTSADPVLQIAAHEEVIPLEELYDICQYARSITLEEPHRVGRIIARPYLGEPGNFHRTVNRHDYALSPTGETALDWLKKSGKEVIGLGKIYDIFNGQGITKSVKTVSNQDGIDQLLAVMGEDFEGLSFLNLVDFDALYGHRRDPQGYARALEAFDGRLPEILEAMKPTDLLLLTADHGNDPTFTGTDHTREYVPLLAYSPAMLRGGILPVGRFSDVGATLCDNFDTPLPLHGRSLLTYFQ